MERRRPIRPFLVCLTALVIAVGIVTCWLLSPDRQSGESRVENAHEQVKHATLQEQFRTLFGSYTADLQRWSREIQAARTEAERAAVPGVDARSYARQIWALVHNAAEDPAALEVYCCLAVHFCHTDEAGRALERLRDHLTDPRLGQYCPRLATSLAPAGEAFLRAARTGHSDESVRQQAALALACHVRWQILERHARTRKEGDVFHLDHLSPDDEVRLIEEVEAICRSTREKHAEIPWVTEDDDGNPFTTTMGKQAEAILESMDQVDIRRLAAGKLAPEIVADDSDGKPLRLSEFRGRVVLLSFGGQHCTPCRQMIPHERDLLGRLKERPFALIGLDRSNDEAADGLKEFLAREKVTWRVCPGRSKDGRDLFRAWNVHAIPVFYLIDAQGTIRQRFDGYTEPKVLGEAVELLVREAEMRGERR